MGQGHEAGVEAGRKGLGDHGRVLVVRLGAQRFHGGAGHRRDGDGPPGRWGRLRGGHGGPEEAPAGADTGRGACGLSARCRRPLPVSGHRRLGLSRLMTTSAKLNWCPTRIAPAGAWCAVGRGPGRVPGLGSGRQQTPAEGWLRARGCEGHTRPHLGQDPTIAPTGREKRSIGNAGFE